MWPLTHVYSRPPNVPMEPEPLTTTRVTSAAAGASIASWQATHASGMARNPRISVRFI
jgi:hypothetical protein